VSAECSCSIERSLVSSFRTSAAAASSSSIRRTTFKAAASALARSGGWLQPFAVTERSRSVKHRLHHRYILVTLCLLLVFCGLRPDVMGFATSGYTWASNQVLYYVNPQNASGMSQAAAITDIQNAATGWTAQTHANIQLVYAGTTSGS